LINGNKVSYEDSGLSKREWNELMEVIDKKNLIVI
jgi:thymidylate synthase (FAD)